MSINIITRTGVEPFNVSLVQEKINKYSQGLKVDSDEVTKQVVSQLVDGMTTKQIDDLTISICEDWQTKHYDYTVLGGRILADRLSKEVGMDFKESLRVNKEFENSFVTDKLIEITENGIFNIQPDTQEETSIFRVKNEYKKYCYRIKKNGKTVYTETPEYRRLRNALALWSDDLPKAIRTYERLRDNDYTHSGCINRNAGKIDAQLANCVLLSPTDNLSGKYGISDINGKVSNYASCNAGIGVGLSQLRVSGSNVKGQIGVADGYGLVMDNIKTIVKRIKRGNREAAVAVYMDIWHGDVEKFLRGKKQSTVEDDRYTKLHFGLMVNNLFMKRVEANSNWSLFSPDKCPKLLRTYDREFEKVYLEYESEGLAIKTVKAQDLFRQILSALVETGEPYIANRDEVNKKNMLKNVGVVDHLNLCVSPDTLILTNQGYKVIKDLENKEITVWNGTQWSDTVVRKTGTNQELITLKFSNGQSLDCTKYHKFYIQTGYKAQASFSIEMKEAKDLKKGDKIIKFTTPVIEFDKELEDAYTQGFFSGDGCRYKENNHIDLYGAKKDLIKYIKYVQIGNIDKKQDKVRVRIDKKYVKFFVPSEFSIKSRLEWLSGLCDSDGTLCNNGNTQHIQISSIHKEFLLKIHLMLQTLGVQSKVTFNSLAQVRLMPDGKGGKKYYDCKASDRLLIGTHALNELMKLGFQTHRLKIKNHIPNRNAEQFIKVVDITDNGKISDTYCVNEPLEHKVIFNGILTGNCLEIALPTMNGQVSTCNISNIVLPSCIIDNPTKGFDFNKLKDLAYELTENLNKVIDITYYPTEEGKKANLDLRPIGVGIQGLADVFAMLNLNYDSQEAKELNKNIAETIYFGCLEASCDLAKKHGAYKYFEGSPYSQGILQYDLWEDKKLAFVDGEYKVVSSNPVKLSGMWNFDSLKEKIKEFGVRNSLVTAYMPTVGSGQILGNNASFEPFSQLITKNEAMGIRALTMNPHICKDLEGLGISRILKEIVNNNGSIQNVNGVPKNIKEKYRNCFEIPMKAQLEMSHDRSPFVDHSQSLNWYLKLDDFAKMDNPEEETEKFLQKLYTLHVIAWKLRLKSCSYYTTFQKKNENVAKGLSCAGGGCE